MPSIHFPSFFAIASRSSLKQANGRFDQTLGRRRRSSGPLVGAVNDEPGDVPGLTTCGAIGEEVRDIERESRDG